jgi:hypothetical protein
MKRITNPTDTQMGIIARFPSRRGPAKKMQATKRVAAAIIRQRENIFWPDSTRDDRLHFRNKTNRGPRYGAATPLHGGVKTDWCASPAVQTYVSASGHQVVYLPAMRFG